MWILLSIPIALILFYLYFNIRSEKELDPLVSNGFRPLVFSPTFPSWNPQKRFDQVLVSDDVKAKARVLQTKLSDHLPILIEIR